jgi:uncharacterized membrane protein (DUF4010 family)
MAHPLSTTTAQFAGEIPLAVDFAFLLGLSFFLGFAFEDVCARAGLRRPGGVRTFPTLALVGGVLYLFDSVHLVAFTGGLLIVGAWLAVYYREHISEADEAGQHNVGLMVVLLNLYAYLLGGIAVALPHWAAVGMTVAVVLLFASREPLHELARRIEIREIITAAQFLILTGLVLPLLPAVPVTTLTSITPRQAWLAVVVVCTLSYASYIVQRYVLPGAGGLWMAALGGLYSSTATTVVLARQVRADPSTARQAQAGITLATGIMYLRILIVVAVFNVALAGVLALPLAALFLCAVLVAILQYRFGRRAPQATQAVAVNRNPLELGPAVTFALLFVAVSLLSNWIKAHFGITGIYSLAAVVGVTDIDPFVLNLAQGGAAGLSSHALAAAILIATSSNNLLKAVYTGLFAGWRSSIACAAVLIALAFAGIGIALVIA